MTTFKTTLDARRELGLTERQMSYLLHSRPELEPKAKLGTSRAWTDADIARVREALAANPVGKTTRKEA